MWHIMKKVYEKVRDSLNANEEFNNKFKSCVWGSANDFEETWKYIMIMSKLDKNE